MNKQIAFLIAALFTVALLASACGRSTPVPTPVPAATSTPIPTDMPTSTPDPCAPENLTAQVRPISRLTRNFDDVMRLAANVPASNLYAPISDLQSIEHAAEDQDVPTCLLDLKRSQIVYMQQFINTLIAFMGGAKSDVVNQGISQARALHDQYNLEFATVLGLPTATPTMPPITATP